jgi:hypothetical protein
MPNSCVVRHPGAGQTVPGIHGRPGGKPKFLHFVASGELATAQAVVGVLKGPGGKTTAGTTKTRATDKFWIIAFHLEAPDAAAAYDLEVRDGSGATLAVVKNIKFKDSPNSLTIDVPQGQDVCPTFVSNGTSTSLSPISTSLCLVGGAAANVTVIQSPNADGEWIVQFSGCALTAPNSTTVQVGQQDGTKGNSTCVVMGCISPPEP